MFHSNAAQEYAENNGFTPSLTVHEKFTNVQVYNMIIKAFEAGRAYERELPRSICTEAEEYIKHEGGTYTVK